jgi:carboxylate-amine ligase
LISTAGAVERSIPTIAIRYTSSDIPTPVVDKFDYMRTVGVEEELLLVGAADGVPAAVGDEVVSAAGGLASLGALDPSAQIEHEFKQEQVETASTPCTNLAELRRELVDLRAGMAAAADVRHAVAVALGTCPVKVRPTQTDDDRYELMNSEFGLLARQQLTCGQHVHVSVESREVGVAVLDRIRVWLPVLIAISSNSPFWQGADTGYASYRTILWSLWPTAGPTELFGSITEYDRRTSELVAAGAALDDGMIYYSARLSARFPTVEIRVADICTSVDDAVLVAALARALVDTAVSDWHAGHPPPDVTAAVLRAAAWRAARFGLHGELFDPHTGTTVDAWQLVDRLVDHASAALDKTNDREFVDSAFVRLRRTGTGADLQRQAAAAGGGLPNVIRDAAERTLCD